MARRKSITQITTDPKALDALVAVMQMSILEMEEDIVRKRKCILLQEERIRGIKRDGKFVAIIESNIK